MQSLRLSSVSAAVQLWCLGVCESLKLHRCIVLFILDDSNDLWARVARCLFLNGCLFLGSIMWWSLVLGPAISWIAAAGVAPYWGQGAAASVSLTLHLAFNVLLLLPIYATTMLASSVEYQRVAEAACLVLRLRSTSKHKGAEHLQRGPEGPPGVAGPLRRNGSASASAGGRAGGGMDAAAQEVFRVVFFFVHYLEVWLLGCLAGKAVYFVLLTWLWSYYCYDYKWSLQAMRLADRLAFFEARWAFFGGFGSLMAALTVMLPFYWGAACSAVLFPLFVIVACDSDPDAVHKRVVGANTGAAAGSAGMLGRIPIFWLALRPTQSLLGLKRRVTR